MAIGISYIGPDGKAVTLVDRDDDDYSLEVATTPLLRLSGPALDALARQVGIADRVCSECGPHGGKGRVLLLESWVDCLTCKA
jgi:hypothetical protein